MRCLYLLTISLPDHLACIIYSTRDDPQFAAASLFDFVALLPQKCLKTAYLILCFSNISGSVALSDATKLPTGMFSILVTIRGSGKNTGPSLMSSTLTWTVAVELGPYPTSGTRGSSFSTLMSRLRNSDAS